MSSEMYKINFKRKWRNIKKNDHLIKGCQLLERSPYIYIVMSTTCGCLRLTKYKIYIHVHSFNEIMQKNSYLCIIK